MQPTSDAARDATPILLAYSGGLDTSFLVPWLSENNRRPIITVTVDTGGIDAAAARTLRERSKALGAIEHHQIDARADYFEQVLRFLIMGNVRRGQLYPLCVGAERVMQAQTIAQGCYRKCIRLTIECARDALQAMPIGIGLDHGHDLRRRGHLLDAGEVVAQGAQMDGGDGSATHAWLCARPGTVRKRKSWAGWPGTRLEAYQSCPAIRPDAPNLACRSGTPGAPPWQSPGNGYPHQ